jgi:hypothetical protein
LIWRGGPIGPSGPIAGNPDEHNVGCNQANQDKHPVLDFETQKGEMLNERMHRAGPIFGQDKRFGKRDTLFLYVALSPTASACEPLSGAAISGRDSP